MPDNNTQPPEDSIGAPLRDLPLHVLCQRVLAEALKLEREVAATRCQARAQRVSAPARPKLTLIRGGKADA
jgi:hypothetical protein